MSFKIQYLSEEKQWENLESGRGEFINIGTKGEAEDIIASLSYFSINTKFRYIKEI